MQWRLGLSRVKSAVLSKPRSSSLDIATYALAGALPKNHILRGPLMEMRMLQSELDSRFEFFDGSAIDYNPYVRFDQTGLTKITDRGFPRAAFTYSLQDVSVDVRYGIPWNSNRDILLGVHGGELEKEPWEAWARNSRHSLREKDLVVVPSTPVYFHWLIEQLPGVLRSLEFAPDARVIIAEDAPSWMIDACLEMSIPVVRHPKGAVFADRYTSVIRQLQTPLPSDLQLLRDAAKLTGHNSCSGKLFISRKYSSRYTSDENYIEEQLSRRGFNVVYPEKLAFREQVNLFAAADTIVGATGSALSNTVWMSEKSKLIVLKGSLRMDSMLWNRLNSQVSSYFLIDMPSLGPEGSLSAILQVSDI